MAGAARVTPTLPKATAGLKRGLDALSRRRVHEGQEFDCTTRILITDATLVQVPGQFLSRLVDRAVLSGMSGAIGIHELIGKAAEASATERELARQYEAAFAFYSARHFEDAARGFEALLSQFPGDKPAELMVQRCRDYVATPPPAEWTGEHVFMRK